MTGAYCLVCRERGPDLIVNEPAPAVPGMRARLTFKCGRCGRLCEWFAAFVGGRWTYEPVTNVAGGGGDPH